MAMYKTGIYAVAKEGTQYTFNTSKYVIPIYREFGAYYAPMRFKTVSKSDTQHIIYVPAVREFPFGGRPFLFVAVDTAPDNVEDDTITVPDSPPTAEYTLDDSNLETFTDGRLRVGSSWRYRDVAPIDNYLVGLNKTDITVPAGKHIVFVKSDKYFIPVDANNNIKPYFTLGYNAGYRVIAVDSDVDVSLIESPYEVMSFDLGWQTIWDKPDIVNAPDSTSYTSSSWIHYYVSNSTTNYSRLTFKDGFYYSDAVNTNPSYLWYSKGNNIPTILWIIEDIGQSSGYEIFGGYFVFSFAACEDDYIVNINNTPQDSIMFFNNSDNTGVAVLNSTYVTASISSPLSDNMIGIRIRNDRDCWSPSGIIKAYWYMYGNTNVYNYITPIDTYTTTPITTVTPPQETITIIEPLQPTGTETDVEITEGKHILVVRDASGYYVPAYYDDDDKWKVVDYQTLKGDELTVVVVDVPTGQTAKLFKTEKAYWEKEIGRKIIPRNITDIYTEIFTDTFLYKWLYNAWGRNSENSGYVPYFNEDGLIMPGDGNTSINMYYGVSLANFPVSILSMGRNDYLPYDSSWGLQMEVSSGEIYGYFRREGSYSTSNLVWVNSTSYSTISRDRLFNNNEAIIINLFDNSNKLHYYEISNSVEYSYDFSSEKTIDTDMYVLRWYAKDHDTFTWQNLSIILLPPDFQAITPTAVSPTLTSNTYTLTLDASDTSVSTETEITEKNDTSISAETIIINNNTTSVSMKTTIKETNATSVAMDTLVKEINDTHVSMKMEITSTVDNSSSISMKTVITSHNDTYVKQKTVITEKGDTNISMRTLIKDVNHTYVRMWTDIQDPSKEDDYIRMHTVITNTEDTHVSMRTSIADDNTTSVSIHTRIGNTNDTMVSMETVVAENNTTQVSMRTVIPSGRDDVDVSMRTYIYEVINPQKVKVVWGEKTLIGFAGKTNIANATIYHDGKLIQAQPEDLGEFKAYLISYDVPQYQVECVIDLEYNKIEFNPDFGGDFKIQVIWHDKLTNKEYVVGEKYIFVKGVNPFTQYNT